MGIWNYFFIAKLLLWLVNKLQFSFVGNLALACLVLMQYFLPKNWLTTYRWFHGLVLVTSALLLTYHEFSMPPLIHFIRQLSQILGFSGEYLKELIERVINIHYVLIGLGCVLLLRLYNRMYRLTGLVLCMLVLAPIGAMIKYQWLIHQQHQTSQQNQTRIKLPLRDGLYAAENVSLGADNAQKLVALRRQINGESSNITPKPDTSEKEQPSITLQNFYKQQSTIHIASPQLSATPNFDILVLHICSLSWEDLKKSSLQQHSLFRLFDIVFENFNSAANYSAPAAIRLQRSYCGQQPHNAIYRAVPNSCHLFSQLADLGYQIHIQMNHDGEYESFAKQVKDNIKARTVSLIDPKQIHSNINSFDGTPIANDAELLSAWWKERLSLTKMPVALYYNSLSLHDGNRMHNVKESSIQTYPKRANSLLNDMQQLINLIAHSKRRVLIVFIPEHGAALSGDTTQVEGLREIPTRAITHVPVGIKWIDGPSSLEKKDTPLKIIQASSYTAIAQLISNWLNSPPAQSEVADLRDYIQNLPITRFVSDSGQNTVMHYGQGDLLQTSGNQWKEIK